MDRIEFSAGRLRALASLMALALPALPALAQGGETMSLTKSGTQSVSWGFPSGTLPTVPGAVKNYTAKAKGVATADSAGSGHAAAPPATGNKLTYTSGGMAGGLPTGTYTSGTVIDTDMHVGALGSFSFGYASITGAHTGAGTNTATATASASMMAMPGGNASFHAVMEDPYDFAMMNGGVFGPGSYLTFSLGMDSMLNDLPTSLPAGAWWESTTAGKVKNVLTSDVNEFLAADPDTLYSLSMSVHGSTVSVSFAPGVVQGFGVIFDQTPSEIESAVAAALTNGWSGNMMALSGRIDLAGTTGAAIGLHEEFDAGLAVVPAPGSAVMAGVGLALILGRRRRT